MKKHDLPASTIRMALIQKRIPGAKIGRDWQVDDEDPIFAAWLAARNSQPRVKGRKKKIMPVINFTPHDVIIIEDGKVSRVYYPSPRVAKLLEADTPMGTIDGVQVVRKEYGSPVLLSREDFLSKKEKPETYELPEEQEGWYYIVPMLVGMKLAGTRSDLIGPDYGIGGVRTADGKISGAVGFIKY